MKYALNMFTYLNTVDEIASQYYEDGVYQPQYGFLNALRVFYNLFVNQESNELIDPKEFAAIVDGGEIVTMFNEAISEDSSYLCFAKAFYDAIDIVNYKKSSLNSLIDLTSALLQNLSDQLKESVSDEAMKKIRAVADGLNNGENTADAIIDAVGDRLKYVGPHEV